jgi:tRNA dimethylallyltransferase
MVRMGIEDEAKKLYSLRNLNALNTVGYKEFFDVFDGKTSKEKAIDLIKRNSRRYAKRQLTWWNKDKEIRWFKPDDVGEMIKYIELIRPPF